MAAEPGTVDDKFCISCGEQINQDAEICPDCGVRQEPSVLSSETKHCADCGSEIKIEAEICPECGVRQDTDADLGAPSEGDQPDASEAFNLMVTYYRHHKYRMVFHVLLTVATGFVWLAWFLFFWIGTLLGWKDVEGMRELRDSGG